MLLMLAAACLMLGGYLTWKAWKWTTAPVPEPEPAVYDYRRDWQVQNDLARAEMELNEGALIAVYPKENA